MPWRRGVSGHGGKPEQQATLQVADAVAVLGPDTNEAVGTVRGCLR